LIETDGVALCVHYRRLKTDRPARPVTKDEEKEEAGPATQEVEDNVLVVDAAKDEDQKEAGLAMQEVHEKDLVVDVTKYEDEKEAEPAMQNVEDNDLIVDAAEHEENKEEDSATQEVEDNDLVVNAEKHEETKKAGPVTQKVQGNDFVVGADPGNTNIIAVAVPKRAEDGADGNLRQKDMRLLRFSRARYYRESCIMNARKKIVIWNSGMKDHLEALSEVTSRGADFKAFREFMKVRVAHWDALGEEYTKPPVGSFAYEFVFWEAAGVREFFQSIECPEG